MQYAIVKPGQMKVIGGFDDKWDAFNYMGRNDLIGFAVVPMESPEEAEGVSLTVGGHAFGGISAHVAHNALAQWEASTNMSAGLQKIQAIKAFRDQFNIGLKEAKDHVDQYNKGVQP